MCDLKKLATQKFFIRYYNYEVSPGGMNISERIIILAICLIILSLEVIPICGATTGDVIVFERKNEQGILGDVGHVGVAFQNGDGTWTAGAIEGIVGLLSIDPGKPNGGWARIFKTKEDVINEFAKPRSSYSDHMPPHAAYEKYKIITVGNSNPESALQEIIKI